MTGAKPLTEQEVTQPLEELAQNNEVLTKQRDQNNDILTREQGVTQPLEEPAENNDVLTEQQA